MISLVRNVKTYEFTFQNAILTTLATTSGMHEFYDLHMIIPTISNKMS